MLWCCYFWAQFCISSIFIDSSGIIGVKSRFEQIVSCIHGAPRRWKETICLWEVCRKPIDAWLLHSCQVDRPSQKLFGVKQLFYILWNGDFFLTPIFISHHNFDFLEALLVFLNFTINVLEFLVEPLWDTLKDLISLHKVFWYRILFFEFIKFSLFSKLYQTIKRFIFLDLLFREWKI